MSDHPSTNDPAAHGSWRVRASGWRAGAALAGWSVLAGCLVLTRAAHAGEAPDARRPIHVRYLAPTGCRSERAFATDLLRRTPRIVLSDAEGPNVDVYDVRIERSETGTFLGTLHALGDVPGEPQRHHARTCADVASALALTLALSVDPDARIDALPEPSAALAPPAPPPSPPSLDVPAPTPVGGRTSFAMGLGGDVLGGAFDRPLLGLSAFGEARGDAGTVRFLARARLVVLTSAAEPPSPHALVTVAWVGFDMCVFGQKVGPLVLWPCVGAEPGVATARARGISAPDAATTFWLSASARGRADLPLGTRFGASLEIAAVAPLVRPRFYVDPQARSLAEAGAVAAEGVIGIWVHFP